MGYLKRLFRLETLEEKQQRLYEERLKKQNIKNGKIKTAEEEKKELEYILRCCLKPTNYILGQRHKVDISREYLKGRLFYDLSYDYYNKNPLPLRKVHELPLDFVEKYKDRIYWNRVGNGSYKDHLKIEKMDIEFVRKFQDKINWGNVGSGESGYTKIEYLPFDFVKEFRHKINWKSVGRKRFFNCYTNARYLPDEFIFEFKNENKYLYNEYLIRTYVPPKFQVEGNTKSIEYSNEGE